MRKGGPIAARSSVNRLWVSFRGTASLKGLIKDFKAHPVPMDTHFAAVSPHQTLLSILQEIPLMLQGCKVHVGFYETYKSISDDVLGCVMQHLSLYPDTEVICTGHSMGGACAVHCAVDLRVRLGPSHPLQVYTFGSPRVGNHKYARMYDLFVPETYRVVYNQDVVVTVPKFLFYYKHVGVEVLSSFFCRDEHALKHSALIHATGNAGPSWQRGCRPYVCRARVPPRTTKFPRPPAHQLLQRAASGSACR